MPILKIVLVSDADVFTPVRNDQLHRPLHSEAWLRVVRWRTQLYRGPRLRQHCERPKHGDGAWVHFLSSSFFASDGRLFFLEQVATYVVEPDCSVFAHLAHH